MPFFSPKSTYEALLQKIEELYSNSALPQLMQAHQPWLGVYAILRRLIRLEAKKKPDSPALKDFFKLPKYQANHALFLTFLAALEVEKTRSKEEQIRQLARAIYYCNAVLQLKGALDPQKAFYSYLRDKKETLTEQLSDLMTHLSPKTRKGHKEFSHKVLLGLMQDVPQHTEHVDNSELEVSQACSTTAVLQKLMETPPQSTKALQPSSSESSEALSLSIDEMQRDLEFKKKLNALFHQAEQTRDYWQPERVIEILEQYPELLRKQVLYHPYYSKANPLIVAMLSYGLFAMAVGYEEGENQFGWLHQAAYYYSLAYEELPSKSKLDVYLECIKEIKRRGWIPSSEHLKPYTDSIYAAAFAQHSPGSLQEILYRRTEPTLPSLGS